MIAANRIGMAAIAVVLGVFAGCAKSQNQVTSTAPRDDADAALDSGSKVLLPQSWGGLTPVSANSEDNESHEHSNKDKGDPDDPQNVEKGTEKSSDDDGQAERGQVAARDDDSDKEHPQRQALPRRRPAEDFPKGMTWLNTQGPLRKQDLKGKFVLLDFWTYCCINCMHILPELKKLEQAFPNELVVIGVHSAKFEGEKDTKNIEDAILRYEIEHPVVNDSEHAIWNGFEVSSWPTIILLDPEGYELGRQPGEFRFEMMERVLTPLIKIYGDAKLLDATPIRFDLLARRQKSTPLRFPGKILTDEKQKRLFIADSNNNRIVIAGYDGTLHGLIGNGAIGDSDGEFGSASFNHPQGMALHGNTLYVADTENHKLRKVDLLAEKVETIAGTGVQASSAWPGMDRYEATGEMPDRWVGVPEKTPLNSPWDLWVHDSALWIAMAGPHQIWKMRLDGREIGPFAGNGREDIVDGKLLPRQPYELGFSSFAQPSGLASDGNWLYVADSEGSSIRAVPFDPRKPVKTIVGTAHLPAGRLFHFGDQDGSPPDVLLQHALGVAYHGGKIYVADTYNNKIKVVDVESGETKTIAGTGRPGNSDDEGTFDEPAGISFGDGVLWVADTNNHAVRRVDPSTGKVSTLEIQGLTAPTPPATKTRPSFDKAVQRQGELVHVKRLGDKVRIHVDLQLPLGWKLNPDAPMEYYLDLAADSPVIDREQLGKRSLDVPMNSFEVELPVKSDGEVVVQIGMDYYYCESSGTGLCKIGSVRFVQPLRIGNEGEEIVRVSHEVDVR